MNRETKQEYLDVKVDQIVENIVDTTTLPKQKKLNEQAQRVLELLRGKQHNTIQESLDVETLEQVEDKNDELIPEEKEKD